jgi:hypothetical protein
MELSAVLTPDPGGNHRTDFGLQRPAHAQWRGP